MINISSKEVEYFKFWFVGHTFFENENSKLASEICTSLQANSVGKETSTIVWRQIKLDVHLSMVDFKFWFIELL